MSKKRKLEPVSANVAGGSRGNGMSGEKCQMMTYSDGEDDFLTIKIPKAYQSEYRARMNKVKEAATKAVLDVITAEDFVKKFTRDFNMPHVVEKVFGMLDRKSLIQAREVSNLWKDFVDNKTEFWSELAKYDRYMIAAEKGETDKVKCFLQYAREKNPGGTYTFGYTVLHQMAWDGNAEICNLMMDYLDDKNPVDDKGGTPLGSRPEARYI